MRLGKAGFYHKRPDQTTGLRGQCRVPSRPSLRSPGLGCAQQDPSPGAQPVPTQLAFCRLCAGSGRALGQCQEAGGAVPVPHSPAPKRFPEPPPLRAVRVSRGRGEVGGWHSPAVEPRLVFFARAPQEAPVYSAADMRPRYPNCMPARPVDPLHTFSPRRPQAPHLPLLAPPRP